MSNTTTTKTTSPDRCNTAVTLTRADDLRLGDMVLLDSWDGMQLVTVTTLALVGDDVDVNEGQRTNFSTSQGNTFHVVGTR